MIDLARKKPSHKTARLYLAKAPSPGSTRASLAPRVPPIHGVDLAATPGPMQEATPVHTPVATRETAKWAPEESAVLVLERVLLHRVALVWGMRLTAHSAKRLRRRKAP